MDDLNQLYECPYTMCLIQMYTSESIGIGIDFGPVRGIGIGMAKLVLSVSDVYICIKHIVYGQSV